MNSPDALLRLHEKAVSNLEIKLANVPTHNMANKTRPTVADIYRVGDNTKVDGLPEELGLSFFFANFNDFKRIQFQAQNYIENRNVVRATWYLGVDKLHSFSMHHENVRYNIILMVYIKAHLDRGFATGAYVEQTVDCMAFIKNYWRAWFWAVVNDDDTFGAQEAFIRSWMDSDYDLIIFGSNQKKRLKKALRRLLDTNPGSFENPIELAMDTQALTPEQLTLHGVALAVEYCFGVKETVDKRESNITNNAAGLDKSLAGMTMNITPEQLAGVNFEAPLTASLLNDIDDTMVENWPAPRQRRPWMRPEVGLDIFENKLTVNDIAGILNSITL
jgi:hypothetical protein